MPESLDADAHGIRSAECRSRGWAGLDRLTLRDGRWTSPTAATETAFTADLQSAISLAAEGSWWYSTRNTMICDLIDRQHVRGPMWEIGSGSGLVTAALEAHGLEVVAVEPGAGSVLAARRGVATSVDSTLEQIALPAASVASIGLFDVLEHVAEPASLLGEIHRVLSPSGHLVLSVPALGWLWSDADVQAGHRCRYNRRSMRSELEAAGFEVTTLGYRFASLVLPLAAGRSVPYRLGIHRAPEVAMQQVARSRAGSVRFAPGSSDASACVSRSAHHCSPWLAKAPPHLPLNPSNVMA